MIINKEPGLRVLHECTVLATLREIYELIVKELNIKDEGWAEEKTLKSRIHSKDIFNYGIRGKDTNKPTHRDKEIEVGRVWVFVDNSDSWELKTFVTYNQAKEYYFEQQGKGINNVYLFINEKLVAEQIEDLYELEYQPRVSDAFRTKEEVEEKLIKYYSDDSPMYRFGKRIEFTVKVTRGGKEIPYKYNKDTERIEWL